MKKLTVIVFFAMVILSSCKKDETTIEAPVLPPVESMIIDFSKFSANEKSAVVLRNNWLYSVTTVGVWNVIIGTTFAVPVASFKLAVDKQPVKLDGTTWQWEYTVDGFTSQYTARLTGTLESSQVKWEMYITKTGIDSFEEFKWIEGTSGFSGQSGQWILYHSAAFPEQTVQIDWKKDAEEVGEVKYTYVREQDNQGKPDLFNGSTLTYGLKDEYFDAYVNVHAYNNELTTFIDTNIEWNRTDFTGRVKAEHYFNDTDWHCWDNQGIDTVCE